MILGHEGGWGRIKLGMNKIEGGKRRHSGSVDSVMVQTLVKLKLGHLVISRHELVPLQRLANF